MIMTATKNHNHWLATDASEIDCLCLGTGRFLRSVLVPALVGYGMALNLKPALIQTRGRSFLEYMSDERRQGEGSGSYEVDTVLPSGTVETQNIPCWGAFSLGTPDDKQALMELVPKMKRIFVVGVGVTEAGLASADTQAMKDLYELLCLFQKLIHEGVWPASDQKICLLDMDNVPHNGSLLEAHMMQLANPEMKAFLQTNVAFLNTMVDRITSQREGSNGMVPRCEPVPAKALVILDPHSDLPSGFASLDPQYGVVLRSTPPQLQADLALKLRVANGTHTAIAHTLALLKVLKTDALSTSKHAPLFMSYLDDFFHDQILQGSTFGDQETRDAYDDWRNRLIHPHFGLSSFFITQNGPAKVGIRIGPTVVDLIQQGKPITVTTIFAIASVLRWLTPSTPGAAENGIFTGWLEGGARVTPPSTDGSVEYADKLRYQLEEGWYEFRCDCQIGDDKRILSEWLGSLALAATPQQPAAYIPVIRAYLLSSQGGNLASIPTNPRLELETLVQAIATMYARMVAGDGLLDLLQAMMDKKDGCLLGMSTAMDSLCDDSGSGSLHAGKPLLYSPLYIPDTSSLLFGTLDQDSARSVVASEVQCAQVIDLHTHLLPPSHGPLCLWGIDELLTYHYLVAEYFMTAPASITPEAFYAKSKKDQADKIWQALFVDRSPISEACRGVITTLMSLGLSKEVRLRDLEGVRSYYNSFRDRGLQGTKEFVERAFASSGIRYAVMTNIPFDANEAQYWRPQPEEYSKRFRSALRVDPLLAGDRQTIEKVLQASGYDVDLEGARQYLRDWCDTMKPEYMMCSTPHDFVLRGGTLAGVKKTGVNEEAVKQPGAFVAITNSDCTVTCDGAEDEAPSVIDETTDFLSEVLMKVCEERDLPVALKIGAHRGVNPALQAAGDGVVAFADAGVLGRLCSRFPKVRFLATFLSRNNQQEACVLASKFRNLHIYGCWWFCNNPSIIKEITQMRIEMLGSAFTAQHSDARVVDQLLYKWPHSRAVIAQVLIEEYQKLIASGWALTRAEVRRDVKRLFGGSYEEFMAKSLL